MKRRIALAAIATTLLSGCAGSATGVQSALPPGARYVAMGSSYAAGPGLSPPKPGTPARCARSPLNYATLLAARLNLDLVDASCSGATSAHILGPWNELSAQIDAVTPDTRLVTVTIGGNDVGFVMNLHIGSCSVASSDKPCPALRLPSESDWTKLESNLRTIARQVHARAPAARLLFVDYVTLLPKHGSCAAAPLSPDSAEAVGSLGKRLGALTARVARDEHAGLLPAGALSRHHTPCDVQPWSVGIPGSAPGAPWHPNAAGHAAIAEALGQYLTKR
ncbi:MAG: SGNH/GDSL hydrolase family protein [Novosphingobium sp.]